LNLDLSGVKSLGGWTWNKLITPTSVTKKVGNIIKPLALKLRNGNGVDWDKVRGHDTVLITGDGNTLQHDVKEFESWGVPHDLFCLNRSLLYFERQVDHWAAVDCEEGCWFAENINDKVQPNKPILRHVIGDFPMAYDYFWEMDYPFENDYQRRIFIGNTAYFAVLVSMVVGYKKMILAGCPFNHAPHWYETPDVDGPNWIGLMYTQWIDFVLKHEHSDYVHSMGDYSAFIVGQATKEWCNGRT